MTGGPLHVLRTTAETLWANGMFDSKTERQNALLIKQHHEALAQVEALVEAAQDVSRIEATGVLPDFQPLADALRPFTVPRPEQTQ